MIFARLASILPPDWRTDERFSQVLELEDNDRHEVLTDHCFDIKPTWPVVLVNPRNPRVLSSDEPPAYPHCLLCRQDKQDGCICASPDLTIHLDCYPHTCKSLLVYLFSCLLPAQSVLSAHPVRRQNLPDVIGSPW